LEKEEGELDLEITNCVTIHEMVPSLSFGVRASATYMYVHLNDFLAYEKSSSYLVIFQRHQDLNEIWVDT